MAKKKPYRNLTGFDQFGDEWDYKDLVKKSPTSEDVADIIASSSTIIYSSYSFPLTAKGDLLTHDGSAVAVQSVGTNKQALVADSSVANGIAWRTLNTTKGDILGYDTDLKRVPVGTNDQVLMADSAQTLGLKWASLTTTKGDLLSHNGSDPIRHAVGTDDDILTSDSTQTNGLAWVTRSSINLGLGGPWIYGDGFDGDLTLAGNTTMTDDENIKCYNDVNLAGFTLTYNSNNFYLALYINGTLTGASGYIASWSLDAGTVGAGGSAGGLPSGGAGGDGCGACYVFAKTVANTTVSSKGRPGVAGTDAQHPADVSGVNVAGGNAAGTIRWRGGNLSLTQAVGGSTVGGFNIVSTGGAGGSQTSAQRRIPLLMSRSPMELVFPLYGSQASDGAAMETNTSSRASNSATGAGGASGAEDTPSGGSRVSGGGGGGGGASFYADGGAGGDGVLSSSSGNEKSAPGGGGGGGAGSDATLVTDDGSSSTCESDGGAGGNAGIGGDLGCQAGDGGGGAGGIAVGVGPGLTVTAAGGIAGSTGNGGVNGGAGRAFYVTR